MDNIITDAAEAVMTLKQMLPEYLENKGLMKHSRGHFYCVFHDDRGKPNMALNPHSGNLFAKCFSCGKSADIFDFANQIHGLPLQGVEFYNLTVPKVAEVLKVKVSLGAPSETSRLKATLHRLAADVANILIQYPNNDYVIKRGWSNLTRIVTGTVGIDVVLDKLKAQGWDEQFIADSKLVFGYRRDDDGNIVRVPFIDTDKFAFTISDSGGRPIGFISRQIDYDKEKHHSKYIHSYNSLIFEKSKSLFGVHCDLKAAKEHGLYIVEGPGDLAALHSAGIYNAVCIMGVALSEMHLLEIKKLGIRKIMVSLDSDEAGAAAMERFIDNVLVKNPIDCHLKCIPAPYKDADEYIGGGHSYIELPEQTTFQFKLDRIAIKCGGDLEEIAMSMVPVIASEPHAIKRNLQIRQLSEFTTINAASISVDVESFRNKDQQQADQAIIAAAKSLALAVEKSPKDAMSLAGTFGQQVAAANIRNGKSAFGPNAQLSRFNTLQEMRNVSVEDADSAQFKYTHCHAFFKQFEGGMPLTRNVLAYFGGKANHGKTLKMLLLGVDVAVSDPDAIVIIHSIDDSYERVEPRIKANIYNIVNRDNGPQLTMDQVNNPMKYRSNQEVTNRIVQADTMFKDLLAQERLVIFDGNDGRNLSFLENVFRYYRERFPNKKILSICDNTHDYEDFGDLDSTTRMKKIASRQKQLTIEFSLAMFATVEYKKNNLQPRGSGIEELLPKDDDIADSRAMTYKPDFICHIYNDKAMRGDQAKMFWKDEYGNKHSRLMLIVYKNKITPFKGYLYYDQIPGSIFLEDVDSETAIREAEEASADELADQNRKVAKEQYSSFDEDDGDEEVPRYKKTKKRWA